MINFCTLFDRNYLDRGIVLYESLARCTEEFCLYILCLDEITYTILKRLNLKNTVIISEEEILDSELQKIKQKRTRSEYCWTCTPVIIQYILKSYQVQQCTYVDADMMFYNNPQCLLDELYQAGASVGIIGHRFPNNIAKRKRERYYGKYCVEFNTFINNELGNTILSEWKENCITKCTMQIGESGYGDQKYLEEWPLKYTGVYEYINPGAGMAPWNICNYRLQENGAKLCVKYKNKVCMPIFYHFQSLLFMRDRVFIGVYNELGIKDKKLIERIYGDYIFNLLETRKMLGNFGVTIPEQKLRMGEGSALAKMNFIDFVIFCYQCIPGIFNKRKNYIYISEIMQKYEK